MKSKYKKMTVACIVLSLFILIGLSVPIRHAEAQTSEQRIPTFGLYCEDQEVIKSGAVKFDLTDSELFSKQRAIKDSEYRVSGNKTVTFEIPFFSSYIDIPQFNVTVDGQSVEGEVWYGDNEVRYGGNNSYLDATSTDNKIIEQKLKRTYSPTLDDAVIGTLYTVIPDSNDITISLKLDKSCRYIFDGTNLRTESYRADGTQSWIYDNALSQSSYQYFFIGENAVIDFTATCEYQTETITFKDFIDRNYNANKDFYEKAGAQIGCIYANANRLLQREGGMKYSELFYDSLSRLGLNTYKFVVQLNGEATIRYSTEATIQVNNRYDPPVYIIGQKQLNNYAINYSISLNSKVPHIVQSSVKTKKSGGTYKSSSTENFYFMCSSEAYGSELSQTQLIVCIVCSIVGGVALICLGVSVGFIIRDKRRAKR